MHVGKAQIETQCTQLLYKSLVKAADNVRLKINYHIARNVGGVFDGGISGPFINLSLEVLEQSHELANL